MSQRGGDGLKFYHALQRGVRAQAGKGLSPLLKRWRYTQSSDHAHLPLDADTARFLIRYGELDAGADAAAQTQAYHALLERAARASGDAPGVVAAWLKLYAAGEYGVLHAGICAPDPRCSVCPLQEGCRYLAGGARDTRAFGESLALELLRGAAERKVDLRAADLLAFLLSGEKSGAADIARAEALLKACNGLRGLFLSRLDLLRELGLNDAALARLQAVAEVCRAWAGEQAVRGRQFTCGRDFYEHFHLRLRDLKQELFIVVILDQKNCALGDEQVSAGSLTETLVHPREVFASAIALRAAAIAVLHNHPSGDPTPSPADKAITRRLLGVAKWMGIRLLDHVIIGDGKFVSFVESGLLEQLGEAAGDSAPPAVPGRGREC